MMENKRNKVVETRSHVTIIPAILKPTTLRMLSKYDRNFSKLNRGRFLVACFLNLLMAVAAATVEAKRGLVLFNGCCCLGAAEVSSLPGFEICFSAATFCQGAKMFLLPPRVLVFMLDTRRTFERFLLLSK